MGVSSGMYLGTEPRIDQETAKIHALFLDYDLTFICFGIGDREYVHVS